MESNDARVLLNAVTYLLILDPCVDNHAVETKLVERLFDIFVSVVFARL